jgi:tetratricopeptide (TPR) repeat protein
MRASSSLILFVILVAAVPNAFSQQPCLPWPAVNGDGIGPFSYADHKARARYLANVELHHFNQDVRTLRKGQSSAYPGNDLHFVLHRFPNHHPALDAMIRLAAKERKERPAGTPETVECYLYRATVFAPADAVAKGLYGVYLLKLGKRKAALEELTTANELRPDNGNVHYNLGLLYFDEKNYDKAKEHAKRAYELGFPLEGLKKKLQSVGAWNG